MQDDDAGPLAQCLDDPPVVLRVVADVVEREVACRAGHAPGAPHDLDLDPPLERRQQQRAVVGDPGALGRQRRVVGDSSAQQPVDRVVPGHQLAGASRPAPTSRARVSSCCASQVQASASAAGVGSTTSPVRAVLRRPRAGRPRRCRHDRLLGQERLVRNHARSPRPPARSRRPGSARRDRSGSSSETRPANVTRPSSRWLAGELLQPLAIRAVTCDHAAQRRVRGERLEQQVDALGPVDAADGEDEVAVLVAAVRQLLAVAAAAPPPRARSSARAGRRRSARSRRACSPRRARAGRAGAPRAAARAPRGDSSNWPSSVRSSS